MSLNLIFFVVIAVVALVFLAPISARSHEPGRGGAGLAAALLFTAVLIGSAYALGGFA